MIIKRILSFLPSLVAVFAVSILAWALSAQTFELQERNARANVTDQLQNLRSSINNQVEAGVLLSRGLANLIRREPDISQKDYSALVEALTDGFPAIANIGWAPELVIQRVHPLEGNERVLGVDYNNLPDQLPAVIRARDTGEIVLVGPIDLIQGGRGVILRMPVYSPNQNQEVAFKGIFSIVYNIEAFLTTAGWDALSAHNDFLITQRTELEGSQRVIKGDLEIAEDNPVMAEVDFYGTVWSIYARPKGGWLSATLNEQLVLNNTLIIIISLLVLVPLIAANALAVSRQNKIRDLRRKDIRLSGLVRNAPGVFLTFRTAKDGSANIDFLTDSAEKLLGVPKEEFYQDSTILWDMLPPEDAKLLLEKLNNSRALLKPWNAVLQLRRPDGQTKWIEGWGHPMRTRNGGTRWDSFMVDVTSQYENAEELEKQAEIARQAQKQESIGQLTGGVAHDFNNMLAVIRGNLEMLQDDLLDEGRVDDERLDFIESSLTAAERGSDLTKNMLSFARRARLLPENLDLNEIVRELETWTRRTLPANIQTSTVLGEHLPQVHVDRSSTASALLNLIVNARDAMKDGGNLRVETKEVTLSAADILNLGVSVEPGTYVRLLVSDTGQGIREETLSKIFDPFFTTKGPGAGSGLGLSMVHGFMQQSDGAIAVDTELGKGTSFNLYFKALPQDALTEPAKLAPSSDAPMARARILLAEDEPEVRKMLTTSLTRLGHDVESAEDGDSALAIFRSRPHFDLLLSDMVMPGTLQGPGLARAVRRIAPDIPVIFLSGYASASTTEIDPQSQADIRLVKPVTRAQLSEAIDEVLKS